MNKNIELKRISNKGMTLPELIIAIVMLTAFTAITVMVSQFTTSFFQPLNLEDKNLKNDRLNDNSKINKAFDSIIAVLSEPAIDKNFVLGLKCTSLPKLEWQIPTVSIKAIPKSYKICIKPSSLTESNYPELANGDGKAGIYILYSKPVGGVNVNSIPIRRIFCRPKPFCKL